MRKLKDLLVGLPVIQKEGTSDLTVKGITLDSREVKEGWAFIAMKGGNVDGHEFISDAIDRGAIAIIVEDWPHQIQKDLSFIQVEDLRANSSIIASAFYDHPSRKLKVVGVTGTNGKTTTATLGYQMCRELGLKAGLLSTAGNFILDKPYDATHTTPDPIRLQFWLAQMVEQGCQWAWMEVSSHALDQGRTKGVDFSAAIFTNLSRDHLDYHGSFRNYLNAKKKLFDDLSKEAVAIINKGDKNASVMVQNCKAQVCFYSTQGVADYHLRLLEEDIHGMSVKIEGRDAHLSIVGNFNASNLLGVYATMRELGFEIEDLLVAMTKVRGAEGRFQRIPSPDGKKLGIVDFAHTPDALEKVLTSIQGVNSGRGKVITVVGCGGDRDAGKRPMMAKAALERSDKVILTSDNPRSEDPEEIIREMRKGLDKGQEEKILEVTDRKQAIKVACALADAGDIILVAGKGHEKYQEIKGKRIVFDDVQVLKEALE